MAQKCRYQTCECARDVSHNEVEVVVDGRNERCQTLTTLSLRRPQVQSSTVHIVVWALISSRLADFMLSRQCGIDEKTCMSGPYCGVSVTYHSNDTRDNVRVLNSDRLVKCIFVQN